MCMSERCMYVHTRSGWNSIERGHATPMRSLEANIASDLAGGYALYECLPTLPPVRQPFLSIGHQSISAEVCVLGAAVWR